jgi:hypothetical protein
MSEQNFLNPSADDPMNPSYGYTDQLANVVAMQQAKSGRVYTRSRMARGRIFDLTWNNIQDATKMALVQWEAQYRHDFFTYYDYTATRAYSGRFTGPLQCIPQGFNNWTVKGQFVELPGLPLWAYPGPVGTLWARDGIFIEERDGFGGDLVKLTGAWTYEVHANAHGGADYFSNTTNDTAEWLYFGYGFKVFSRTQNNLGKVEISLDGTVMTTVDLYSAGAVAALAVYTWEIVSLGLHRVKLRVTGTKNAASSGFVCYADAIQVMQ